jgi:Tfp pilus assembly protein PilX
MNTHRQTKKPRSNSTRSRLGRSKAPRSKLKVVRDEAGIAMIVVMMVVMLLTLIPLAIFTQALQQLPLARHSQDHEAALAAAEAGVDDYLNRLNQNSNYWTYNAANQSSPANAAFTSFVPVAGPGTTTTFRYTPDTTKTAVTGVVYLTSTGKSRNVMRTVKVGIRKQSFLDYLYMTDYEVVDPALTPDPSSCLKRAWEYNSSTGGYGPGPASANCDIVYWTDTASLDGPVHSNDALYICGDPDFNGDTDTYYNSPTSQNVSGSTSFGGPGVVKNKSGCSNSPFFNRANDPASGANLSFPAANTAIKNQADGTVGGTGCLYTGPTTITLKNTGLMDVVSSKTRSTNSGCAPGTNKSLPVNGVIYVQTVPTSSSNPNYSSCSGSACNGDVSVKGTLKGQLTIAAQNDVIITGNLQYNTYPGGTDVLGLIANNNVAIYHPTDSNENNASGSITDPRVDAAILAIDHSFYVQNWDEGDQLGTLTVNGAITQEFRGAVGTFGGSHGPTGYDKEYNYDARLKYLSPPYFLSPTASAWTRLSYSELVPDATP